MQSEASTLGLTLINEALKSLQYYVDILYMYLPDNIISFIVFRYVQV